MGAGVAKALARKFPEIRMADNYTAAGDSTKLGSYTVGFSNGKTVFNLYTQYRYGHPSKGTNHLDYQALRQALTAMKRLLDSWDEPMPVAMPRIGCGLAGGKWSRVEDIINKVFPNRSIYVYTL